MSKVEETTQELDLKRGVRAFLVTTDEDTQRFRVEVACEMNNALLGGPPDWKPLEEITVPNDSCKHVLLDVIAAMHLKPYTVPLKP